MLRSLVAAHFDVKMFLKICSLGKSFITIPKVVLGLQKKKCAAADQLRGGSS